MDKILYILQTEYEIEYETEYAMSNKGLFSLLLMTKINSE